MITYAQLSQRVKDRVIKMQELDIVTNGRPTKQVLKSVVLGLALSDLNLEKNGALGDGVTPNAEVFASFEQIRRLAANNHKHYLGLAKAGLLESAFDDAVFLANSLNYHNTSQLFVEDRQKFLDEIANIQDLSNFDFDKYVEPLQFSVKVIEQTIR